MVEVVTALVALQPDVDQIARTFFDELGFMFRVHLGRASRFIEAHPWEVGIFLVGLWIAIEIFFHRRT